MNQNAAASGVSVFLPGQDIAKMHKNKNEKKPLKPKCSKA